MMTKINSPLKKVFTKTILYVIMFSTKKEGKKMRSLSEEKEFWTQLVDMLEQQFGVTTEIVLHDLTKDYENTIIDIRNGYITGRKIGGSGSNLGLEVLAGTVQDGNRFNYITQMKNNRLLRSSSLYIKDDNGKVIGSLCINTDITDSVKFETYLREHNRYSVDTLTEEDPEVFTADVNQLLEYLLQKGQAQVGKPAAVMSKEEKLQFLKYLNDKGAFLITRSGDRVQELLGISKNTMYTYLDMIKGKC